MWKNSGCIVMVYLISCTVPHVFYDICLFCFQLKQVRKNTLRITILMYCFCLIISRNVRLMGINISDW
jgi:hypothetical protein